MKNVNEIAKEMGVELPEGFEKKLLENYKTVGEFEKVKGKLDTLTDEITEKDGKIEELNKSISEFDGNTEQLEALQKQVESYEEDKKERELRASQEKEDSALKNALLEAIGEKQFSNSFVEDSVFNKIKSDLAKSENKGKGVSELLEAHTKDVDGIWKNPNKPDVQTPKFKQTETKSLDGLSYEEYKAVRKGQ